MMKLKKPANLLEKQVLFFPDAEDDSELVLCSGWVAEKDSGEQAEEDVYLLAEMINTLDLDNFCCCCSFFLTD